MNGAGQPIFACDAHDGVGAVDAAADERPGRAAMPLPRLDFAAANHALIA